MLVLMPVCACGTNSAPPNDSQPKCDRDLSLLLGAQPSLNTWTPKHPFFVTSTGLHVKHRPPSAGDPSQKHWLHWLYHMFFSDETVIGWKCHWMKVFWMKMLLDEIVFGWKCQLDEIDFGWKYILPLVTSARTMFRPPTSRWYELTLRPPGTLWRMCVLALRLECATLPERGHAALCCPWPDHLVSTSNATADGVSSKWAFQKDLAQSELRLGGASDQDLETRKNNTNTNPHLNQPQHNNTKNGLTKNGLAKIGLAKVGLNRCVCCGCIWPNLIWPKSTGRIWTSLIWPHFVLVRPGRVGAQWGGGWRGGGPKGLGAEGWRPHREEARSGGAAGGSTRQPESPNVHIWASLLTQKKEINFRREKKERNFGGPSGGEGSGEDQNTRTTHTQTTTTTPTTPGTNRHQQAPTNTTRHQPEKQQQKQWQQKQQNLGKDLKHQFWLNAVWANAGMTQTPLVKPRGPLWYFDGSHTHCECWWTSYCECQ